MTIKGEHDDIRTHMRTHCIQTGVGYYSIFSGRKWNQQIYPRMREMIHASMGYGM